MKREKSLQPSNDKPLPSFADIARLIVPTDTPTWLSGHFEGWAPCLKLDYHLWEKQPTKAEMKSCLTQISEAAALLDRLLGDNNKRAFLEAAGNIRIANLGGLQRILKLIALHARIAAGTPTLSGSAGNTRSGRGKAMPPDGIVAKTYCALIIAETWWHFHGKYPRPRNPKAAAAADAFWRRAVGDVTGWGNEPLNAWRHYFVKAQAAIQKELREEHRRHLRMAEIHMK